MKFKHILTVLTSLASFAGVYSQEFQGEAVYMSKTRMDFNFGGRELSEEQRKAIQERMSRMGERTYVMTFNRNEAVYKEEESLGAPGEGAGGGMRMNMMGSFAKSNYYKNTRDAVYFDQREMFGKIFLIRDTLAKFKWEMGSETKKIGDYTCYKATTTIKSNPVVSMMNFRRPGNEASQSENGEPQQKDVTITAWYTLDIPVSQGPDMYWGLPGLILEVNDDRTTILCTRITMNSKEVKELKAPSKGKEISQEEYDKLLREKMEEMREQFRNRRGPGEGFRRQ